MAAKIEVLGGWSFLTGNVQTLTGADGDFLSSESAVLCAGPADLPSSIVTTVVPIGLVQNVQVTQNKQIQQLFEVGSREPFFIPGRTETQIGISRALFDGPSLLKMLYKDNASTDNTGVRGFDAGDEQKPGDPYTNVADTGTAKMFINLASEFFNRQLGLCFIFHDMTNEKYGGFYVENCLVQSHGISMASQQTVLLENLGIRGGVIVPIEYQE